MAGNRNSFNRGLVAVLFSVLAALAGCGENERDITPPSLTFSGTDPVTTTRTHHLAGTVEPGATVTVTVTPAATVGPVTVVQERWACTVEDLAPGNSTINLKAADATGNQTILAFAVIYDAVSIETFVTPIADGVAGLTVGGLVDPDESANLTIAVPTGVLAGPVSTIGDAWTVGLANLTTGNNLITARLAHSDPALGTQEKSLIVNVNASAPGVTIDPVASPTVSASQTVAGTRDTGLTITVLVPTATLEATDLTTNLLAWSNSLTSLTPGKNVLTASGTANAITATARDLIVHDPQRMVIEQFPTPAATGIDAASVVAAVFAAPMAAPTVTAGSFTLAAGGAPVTATVDYSESLRLATLTPAAPLAAGTTYTATLATAITDAGGSPLAQEVTWAFTTAP
jgi:hypothetical protein